MTAKIPSLRTKTKRGNLLRPLYVLALRMTSGLTQAEAGKVVHVNERTWRKWEGEEKSQNHRYPGEAYVELFCRKQGLTYPPKFNREADEKSEEEAA